MINLPDNDNNLDSPMVFIVIAKAYEEAGGEAIDVHVMVAAPDDDSAVRAVLNALSEEGFVEADLDQIGMLQDIPDEEPHASAYQGALEGEVSIIRFG
ncbi:transcriptional regulator [Ciceribacter sp. L1K23]|uniref:transcriptional regulator n=1 Tax=unclassified Ciceribacter TaxID=2628820 RepID=UPI001ABDA847|nr:MULTISPECIES: transcriptional regulator [unclassified Ciceribacter]MBO3759922.1 transcriptional regulator [Ciceribacter sp. L1K22]MBR0555930.1 transcriptional regulator [Ciceribacter sp. L1K23]